MVDITYKACESDKCKTRPSYNIFGKISARFCSKHKEPDMVNIRHKRCEYNGCITRPQYNIKGETVGKFCSKHKER